MNSPQRAVHEPLRSVPPTPRRPGPEPAQQGWFGRWFGGKAANPPAAPLDAAATPLDEEEAFLAFPSEGTERPAPAPKPSSATSAPAWRWRPFVRPAAIILGVGLGVTLGVVALRRFPMQPSAANQPRPGRLTIDTRPANLPVIIDGGTHGTTPLTVSLAAGPHTVTIRSGTEERVVPLTLAAGADVTHYFEMKVPEPAITVGRLSIVTDPPGARVSVDGKLHGASPITVEDLTAATHKITAANDAGSVERTVAVPAGGTASVMFSLPRASGPMGGWLSVASPFDLEVVERDELIGTSGTTKIMLAAGKHQLLLANRRVGFQETRAIDITAGKTMTLRIDPPKAAVNINARPWADVTLDGNSLGQTPIASILVTIGTHEMIFRHPQFGERRQTVVVTSSGPNRIAVDLTK